MRALVWIRRDQRVEDQTALYEACRAASAGVIAVYVICTQEWRNHDDAPAKIEFWLRNLRALSAALARLNIPLLLIESERTNRIAPDLLGLAREHDCGALYFNHEYEVNERARDEAVTRHFEKAGLSVRAFHDHVVFDPASIRTGEGGFYSVFTPFKRAFLRRVEEDGLRALPGLKKQAAMPVAPSAVPERSAGFESAVDAALWPGGEKEARARLERFCRERIDGYKDDRDAPALDATSRLSAYLNAGVISPRQCLIAARAANHGALDDAKPGAAGPATWISEVIWREFYQHVLVGFPRVSMGRAFRPATDRIVWSENAEHLERWREGRTGVPIVDAAMNQLAQTGWMHNRLRMIVAMYLTKDLFLNWREGERHFMRNLVDGDLGSNNGGWQWSASTGTDAAPYFRIFNPISQSKRCDPQGAFIKRWLPVLRGLEGEALHDPSLLPPLARSALDYPPPMVDRAGVKERVVAAFKGISP